MKPASEASGVRSSWLALATKSTRTRSVRRRSVRSSRMRKTSGSRPPLRAQRRGGANQAAYQRSVGTRSANSTCSGGPAPCDAVEGGEEVGNAEAEVSASPAARESRPRRGG